MKSANNIVYIDNRLSDRMYNYYGAFYYGLQKINVNASNIGGYNYERLKTAEAIVFGLGFFDSNPAGHGKLDSIEELPGQKIAILHKIKNFYEQKIEFCKLNKIDKILTTTPFADKIFKDSGIPTFTLPYCANSNVFKPLSEEKKVYDIGFSGALHAGKKLGCEDELQNIRVKIHKKLSERKDLKLFWNGTDSIRTRIHNNNDYVKKINQCKLWLCVTGPSFDVNPRFHEVMLCQTVPFMNSIPTSYYDTFYEDKKNCVIFKNDLSDLNAQLDHALLNYENISKNAFDFGLKNCTRSSRAQDLLNIINKNE